MTLLSIYLPTQPSDPSAPRIFARAAFEISAHRLWAGQTLGIETHDVFALLSGLGYGMRFASGVQLTGLRHPLAAAVAARSTAVVSGHEFVLGLGPGSLPFRRAIGAGTSTPVTDTREYAAAVRALLHTGSPAMPVVPSPPVRVGLGVLGPRMATAAAAVADFAVTWLAPRRYLRDTVMPALVPPQGRTRPSVVAVVHCAVDDGALDRERTVSAVVGAHLSAPHYQRMLRRAGLSIEADDAGANVRAVLAENVFVTGTPERIAEELHAYAAEGVDEIVVNVGGVFLTRGASAAVDDLRAIFSAFRDRALRSADSLVPLPVAR